jgi:hypothetical protein
MSDFNSEFLQGDKWINAIHEWCNAKGIDPKKVFAANGWSEEGKPKKKSDAETPVFGLSRLRCKPNRPINTSVFEEAEIIE